MSSSPPASQLRNNVWKLRLIVAISICVFVTSTFFWRWVACDDGEICPAVRDVCRAKYARQCVLYGKCISKRSPYTGLGLSEQLVSTSEPLGSYAFITTFIGPTDNLRKRLDHLLALARSVQVHSVHPLLVLTSEEIASDWAQLNFVLNAVGAHTVTVHVIPMPECVFISIHDWHPSAAQQWKHAYSKIHAWSMTEYDKLLMVDTDMILTRNIDTVFQRQGTWMQEDNIDCGKPGILPCSGAVLLQPSMATFIGIIDWGQNLGRAKKGDQEVIASYFIDKCRATVHVFESSVVGWGCHAMDPAGQVPALIHKPPCASRHRNITMCSNIRAGTLWYTYFCEAARLANVDTPEDQDSCNSFA